MSGASRRQAPHAAAVKRAQRRGAPMQRPQHPGEFLEARFLRPMGITQTELASALGISRRRVNELVNARRAITPDTAMRLAVFFRNDAALWMHMQVAWDMQAAAGRPRPARRKK